jgi:cyclophilin family peptidyl-prolyl cis-trans isomerase
MNYLSKKLSNLTSLIILLILSIATASLFFMASKIQVQADNNWEAYQATFEKETGTRIHNISDSLTAKAQTNINNKMTNQNGQTAEINTNKGTIVIQFYSSDAPNTVANFIKLANAGFYDDTKFHRVIKNFMIQGGDPISKTDDVSRYGTGGPGYTFADELDPNTASYKTGYVRGTVAMANSGPNTNGSQFFIMHKDTPLPPNYTIFGKVIQGMAVVDTIANVQTGSNDRPLEPVIIKTVKID